IAELDPVLMVMLAWAALSIGLEINRLPNPELSWLDDCAFLPRGACRVDEVVDGPFYAP
ncbi:hypothetical protein M9458_017204, partial [Cirrhinus mrigala]